MGIAQLELIYEGLITCFTIVVLYNYCGLFYVMPSTVYYDTNLLSAVQTQGT